MDLNISYEDLLSGDCIYANGIGHVRSPKLKEMWPSSGIGWDRYNYYIFFLKIGENQLSLLDGIDRKENETLFECMVRHAELRELYLEAFSFFIAENVIFDDRGNRFLVYRQNDENSQPQLVGIISTDNFDYVRAVILLLNYIPLDQTDIQTTYESKAAEEAWKNMQRYLDQQEPTKKDESMNIGNILSKLCAIHPSINYLNVFELTVFQFYDAFFQCCYMHSVSFTEAIVSNHGSKEFKYESWLKPVRNY